MLQIGKTIVSLDILEQEFCCDLHQCRGACCVEGDSGAPVTLEEVKQIKELYTQFEEYLSERNRAEIKKQGFSITDADGDLVTPLINNNECVYSFTDDEGITNCAIEKAFFEKGSSFRKPVSCHLFPIRITEYKRFDAINYEKLVICKSGRICGTNKKVPLWQYLKEPLTCKYGKKWYHDLETAASFYSCKSESDIVKEANVS
jgi:hypothetical protein